MKKKHAFHTTATNAVAPAAPRSIWGKVGQTMGGKTTNGAIIEKNEKENKNG